MAGLTRKSFSSPDETRPFEDGKGQVEVISTCCRGRRSWDVRAGLAMVQHVKPIAGPRAARPRTPATWCSGRMKVVMDDGEETEYGPGDFAQIAPGHDAWIVGDEPCVFIDWQGFAEYAKR